MPFNRAISAINASSIAPTFSANCMPEAAPEAAASITLAGRSSSAINFVASSLSWVFSVSGTISLANSRPPGAAMNEAAIRYSSGTPIWA
ncbi:hypothetical protein D3C73_1295300 [compost metagenome]